MPAKSVTLQPALNFGGEILILGIGVDIVEISRIEKALKSSRFAEKIYTEREKEYKMVNTLAGCFAAKEAISKAFGTGFSKILPKEIEIVKEKTGKPFVILHGNAKKAAEDMGITDIHLSISHSKDNAVAFAVAEKKGELK